MIRSLQKTILDIKANTASKLIEAQFTKIPKIAEYDDGFELTEVDFYTYIVKKYTVESGKTILLIQNIPYSRKMSLMIYLKIV